MKAAPGQARLLASLVFLALVVRVALLVWNQGLDLPALWKYDARAAIVAVNSDMGRVETVTIDGAQYSAAGHVRDWLHLDRGIAYPHMLFKALFGESRYVYLQVLNLVVDSLMVIPIFLMARRLGGGGVMAALLYALFLPQIFLVLNPSYDCWLTFGFILATFLYLRLVGQTRPAAIAILAVGLGVVVGLLSEFRSILSLYCFGMAGWTLLAEAATLLRPGARRQALGKCAALVAAGFISAGSIAAINWATRGELSPVRSSVGHSFWAGVGQFANPFGLTSEDSSVTDWYTRETGIADTENTMGVAYNAWLTARAKEFIRDHPLTYGGQVLRRALLVLGFDDGLYLVADQPSYNVQFAEDLARKRQQRIEAVASRSPAAIARAVADDPGYFLRWPLRLVLMVGFPLGVLAALALSGLSRPVVHACLPLAYALVTISPFYGPLLTDTSYYAAMIPVVLFGWTQVLRRFRA